MALNFSDTILVLDVNKIGNKNDSYLIYNYTNKREETVSVNDLKAYLLNGRALNCHQQTYNNTVIIRMEDDKTSNYLDEIKGLISSESYKRVLARVGNNTKKSTPSTSKQPVNTKTSNTNNKTSSTGSKDNTNNIPEDDLRNHRIFIKELLQYAYKPLKAEILTKVSPSGEVLYAINNVSNSITKIILSKDRIDYCNGKDWRALNSIEKLSYLIANNLSSKLLNLEQSLQLQNESTDKTENTNLSTDTVNSLNNQIESLKLTLQTTQDALNSSNEKIDLMENNIAELKGSNLVLISEKNSLAFQNENLENKVKDLEEQIKDLEEKLKKSESGETKASLNLESFKEEELTNNISEDISSTNTNTETTEETGELDMSSIWSQALLESELGETTEVNEEQSKLFDSYFNSDLCETINNNTDNSNNIESFESTNNDSDDGVYQWSLDGCLDTNTTDNSLKFDNSSDISKITIKENENADKINLIVYSSENVGAFLDSLDTTLQINDNHITINEQDLREDLDITVFEASRLLKEVIGYLYSLNNNIIINNSISDELEILKLQADSIIEIALNNIKDKGCKERVKVEN